MEVEMKIRGLMMDPVTNMPIVILKDSGGEAVLPIWVGIYEANAIAQSCYPAVKRITRTGPAPDHKPSILQDFELGRAMEIDVLVRAPAAFARAAGLSTPMLDMMAALAIRQAREKGLYRAG